MADPAKAIEQNLLPVQAFFDVYGNFQTFIGQGKPFYASINPVQSGLTITNSTINSTTIGALVPSTGVFTDIQTTTGQISTSPVATTDIANKAYVDAVAQGLGPKAACEAGTTVNLTSLSGLLIIDTYQTVAGNRILVKNQIASEENGIYIADSGAWSRAPDLDNWSEVRGAYTVLLGGTQIDTGWVCVAAKTGTIGVTAMPWVQFASNSTYFAGTGLTLASNTFSITNTGVTAATYGSASKTSTLIVNAQGQITSASEQNIAIATSQITSGTLDVVRGGTGQSSYTDGQILIGNTTGNTLVKSTLTAGTGISIGNGSGSITVTNSAPDQVVSIAGGTGISTSGTYPAFTVTNTAPDQTVALASGTGISVTGTYPNFTIANTAPSSGGTVTSVGGTGTVSGLTLSGTVTTTGNLTLGGTLDLSAPPVIGGTTPNTITGTTITANTKFVGTYFDASGSGGGNLRTASGTACFQWGAGGGTNCTVDGSINMNGANAHIDMSPTGIGHVSINPTGIGDINNVIIGATTALAGSFTDLSVTGTTKFDGSEGTTGQVLTSAGVGSTPTWTTPTAYATVTDDTTTNGTRYPLFANQTAGNLATSYTSSTKYQYNPSTGVLTATGFSGSGASLTSLTAGNLSGTIPSGVLGNSTLYIGTTAVVLNAASGSITSLAVDISGSAGSATTATTATNATNVAVTDNTSSSATWYPTIVSTTTGNLPITTSSTKLSFVPSTGVLSANGVALTGNLGTVTSVAALTLGTTGTDLSSTVATGTTTPVITLQVPTASATNRGALSAADWTTFNNKAPAVTYTTNYIPYGQGTTTPNQSAGLQFDGTNFTTTGYATATSFRPSSATVPTNGMYLPAANSIGIATASTNRLYINASGNVGIGTASPSVLLAVYGYAAFQNATTGTTTTDGFQIQQFGLDTYLWNYENSFISFGTSAAEKMRLHASGGVSIGNTTDPGAKSLNVSGLIFPQQAATASAPAYVKGAIYFDTTLNKLRVGGATAWETITSV